MTHGYARGDTEHTARAILLIHDLARVYEGTLNHAFGPYINQAPPPPTPIEPSGPDSRNAVIVPPSELKTVQALGRNLGRTTGLHPARHTSITRPRDIV